MKHIYTAVFLCLSSLSFAQSLSFPEALERMRGANQKLKGMGKASRGLPLCRKELQGFVPASAKSQCQLCTPERAAFLEL